MQEISGINIIEGLKDRDTKVLDYVYENFYHQIKVFVLKNSGSEEDAKDIYQDAILVIFKKACMDNLKLSCSFSTYLYSVSRLLWLKQLELKKQQKIVAEETSSFIELDSGIAEIFEKNERYKLYQNHFQKLSYSCQKILELFLAGVPLKEIANILGFKSGQYAKKRKHQCKEKLIGSIRTDPEFIYFNNHVEIKSN